jgi:hypothetical protein
MKLCLNKLPGALFILSLLVIISSGCRREIDYELAYPGDRLVINGVISPQRIVTVNISRSNAPSGEAPPDLSVTDATVRLYENSLLIETLMHRQKGQYESPSGFKTQPGKQYTLQVTASGFPPAETSPAIVPDDFVLENYLYRTGIKFYLNPSKPAAEVEITIQDPAGTVDFYQIEVTGIYNNENFDLSNWLVGETEEAKQPCTLLTNNSVIYRDNCFNGTTYRSIIGVETSGFITEQGNPELKEVNYQKLRVRLQRISADYYRYLETADLNEGIELAFFEPSFLYSNVKGGLGIWAAANEKEIIILL